ncbi:ABC transporter substrate-binding protein [Leifsonia sp. Root112D2]|uniref:ABC transporter substrate-binding protein n=1 Tax=Leifsonia sp. Root112D2 TaxID=1736426 RepID=UPI0007008004|nr:sugar ABC transporter substrate-binding protein [Leifsonia sp. Root112D2]KQV06506.1 hypothetical protein ASC63_03480 [Leifsonia sp. Root112D2]
MKSTKIIGALLTAVTAAALLSSCAAGSSSNSKTELTFWDGNAIPERTVVWKQIISDFEKVNPDITVKYVGLPQDTGEQKFNNAIATHSAPDLGVLPRGNVPNYYAQNALVPLDKYLKDSSVSDQIRTNFLDTTRGYVSDGKLYALPTHYVPDILWYRPQLFEAAGVTPPATWDEFYSAASALTNSKKGEYGFTMRGGAGAPYQLLPDLYTASGVTSFFNSSGKSTLNDPKNIAALERFVSLYGKNTPSADVTNGYPEMQAEFQGGKVAMMQHNLGSYPTLIQTFNDSQIKALPLPKSKDGAPSVIVPSAFLPSMGIFKSSSHQDAAWKFLEFTLQTKNDSKLAEQAGGIPANKDVQVAGWSPAQPAVDVALKLFNDPKTVFVSAPVYLPDWASIMDTKIDPLFQKVLLGKASAKDLMNTWAKLIDDAQASYKARQH